MSNPNPATNDPRLPEPDDTTSVVFAQMIMQHSNLALIFLGKTPNPQTGEMTPNLDHARFLIDQLEMLAVKTRGNLDSHEDALLKQTLTGLRLAFVNAVSKPQPPPGTLSEKPAAAPAPDAPKADEPPSADDKSAESAESHKKFTKKY